EDIDGYGINPRAVEDDIREEFGDVVRAVWPTEVFLIEDALEEQGVTVEDVARFLGGHTLEDNDSNIATNLAGAGRFEPQNRLFELAIPAAMLPEISCAGRGRPED
nr:DUF438 domain-containing protein [Actinomycetota bacterium]